MPSLEAKRTETEREDKCKTSENDVYHFKYELKYKLINTQQ